MTAFLTPANIGDRALQHCGAKRMDQTLGFRDTSSRSAAEISFCYDKVREAELQENPWTCALRRTALRAIDVNTMLLAPGMWAETTTYFKGCIVSDQSGNLWISNIPSNLNNDPLLSTYWDPYFGPMAVPLYAAGSYFAGELVYTAAGNGTNRVYLSLQNGNDDNPGTATPYSATATYNKNQVVTYLSVAYMSAVDLNTGNQPNLTPAPWSGSTTYAATNRVTGADGVIYQSVGSGNLNNDPVADTGIFWTNTGTLAPWTTTFTGGTGSLKWVQIGGAEFPIGVGLTTLNILYPPGAGPTSQAASRNVFMLPAGYLRKATSQHPKGTVTWLGGPAGIQYDDWDFENGLLVSIESGPILFRFVANLTDVRRFAPMFSEALAARIALEVCETLTQSTAKMQSIAKVYQEWIDRARQSNAIEQGYDDPPDDDYVSVRL